MPFTYAPQFRAMVVEQVRSGRKAAEVAASVEIPEATVYRWVRQDRIDRGELDGNPRWIADRGMHDDNRRGRVGVYRSGFLQRNDPGGQARRGCRERSGRLERRQRQHQLGGRPVISPRQGLVATWTFAIVSEATFP